jgi:glycosyltransferase involved in cell wall biosynthesis
MCVESRDKDNIIQRKKNLPLVSLVITSYNRSEFIRSAIESSLAQDYPNLEIIISDNCSTDNTDEVVKEYLHDSRIRYSVNNRNIGMLPNFIKATKEIAKGKYITYVSSDDYLVNEKFISEAIFRIQQFPSVLIVHSTNMSEILATNECVLDYSYTYYKNTFYKMNYVEGFEVLSKYPECHSISFGGTVFNREEFISIRPFDGDLFSFDVQMVLQLIQLGDVAFIDKKTYVVRRHGGNMTSMVSNAQTYISNLAYIETPYRLALERNQLDKLFLAKWREDMYCNFCSQCLLNLYKQEKSEYEIFSSYVKNNHPVVFKRITNQLNWHSKKIIYASEFRKKLYFLVIRSAKKIKSTLVKITKYIFSCT